jgi:hypothetical protein
MRSQGQYSIRSTNRTQDSHAQGSASNYTSSGHRQRSGNSHRSVYGAATELVLGFTGIMVVSDLFRSLRKQKPNHGSSMTTRSSKAGETYEEFGSRSDAFSQYEERRIWDEMGYQSRIDDLLQCLSTIRICGDQIYISRDGKHFFNALYPTETLDARYQGTLLKMSDDNARSLSNDVVKFLRLAEEESQKRKERD